MYIAECTPTICANTDGTVGDGERGHGYEFEDVGVPVAQKSVFINAALETTSAAGTVVQSAP